MARKTNPERSNGHGDPKVERIKPEEITRVRIEQELAREEQALEEFTRQAQVEVTARSARIQLLRDILGIKSPELPTPPDEAQEQPPAPPSEQAHPPVPEGTPA